MGLETLVDWPKANGEYKVVQFIVDDKPYLRFGNDLHDSIVRQFAREINVQTIVRGQRALYFLPKEDRFKMHGMGRCELRTIDGKRTAEFFGGSRDYFEAGIIGIDDKHLDLVRLLFPGMNIIYNPSR